MKSQEYKQLPGRAADSLSLLFLAAGSIFFVVATGSILALSSTNKSKRSGLVLDIGTKLLRKPNSTAINSIGNEMKVVGPFFEEWPSDVQLPCFPDGDEAHTGFVYIRPSKTASSLLAGVNTRIARNVAMQLPDVAVEYCRHTWEHFRASDLNLKKNQTTNGDRFLWTMIRDPSLRAVDEFFHIAVTLNGKAPSYDNFQEFMLSTRDLRDYFLRYLCTTKFHSRSNDAMETIQQIFNDYNFIGVVERLDESLVVLSMLLRLELGDVLYLTANLSDDYDNDAFDGRCPETPSIVTPEMETILKSDDWKQLTRFDSVLLQQVNQKLDATIDRLGRLEVQEKLARFRAARREATKRCMTRTKFACNIDGSKNSASDVDCVPRHHRVACGMRCLDEVASDFRTW